MSGKFRNKYRIASTRLQNWNYGWDAAYFVTICTKDRICYFGNVGEGKMQLSEIGVIANVMWYEIKNHAKNVELDAFIVMPNHVHGIIILNGNDHVDNVETTHALSLRSIAPTQTTIGQQRFQNQGKNTLSSIIGSYKSAVTKHCNRLGFGFAWQPRFHDHIVRDDASFQNISTYIQNNPSKWSMDKFYI
jgi:REP element-mobilizing transposase RayT